MMLFALLFALAVIIFVRKIYERIGKSATLIGLSIYLLLFLYLFEGAFDASTLSFSTKHRNICVEFKDGEIIPAHDSKYYIGRTPEYIFIYNEKDSCTKVYNASELKNITSYKDHE